MNIRIEIFYLSQLSFTLSFLIFSSISTMDSAVRRMIKVDPQKENEQT